MKARIFSLLATALVLVSCSKEEKVTPYTEYQQKAFSVFVGTWADTQFSNLCGADHAHLLPEPDKIVFGINLPSPENVHEDDFMNGETLLFERQGECVYYDMPYKDQEYEVVECYYSVTPNADYLRLYEQKDNTLYKSFEMSIESETKIILQDKNITLPYIFEKQK